MSASATPAATRTCRWLVPESIGQAAIICFMVTVLHRGLSFVRATIFANVLSPAELGLWDMTFGFGLLAAPIVVLGLPACLARFAPRYEQRGHLWTFFKRILRICVSTTLGLALVFGLADRALAVLIYGDAARADLARLAAMCLAGLALFDILQTVFQGLRLFRMVSLIHVLLNISFASIGIGLLWLVGPYAKSVACAHVVSTFVVVVGVGVWLYRRLPADQGVEPVDRAGVFWRRMATYALWVWVVNTLMSLLIYVDRVMLIHWSGRAQASALAQLGAYHVFRLVALLVVTFAGVINSVMVPHMGHHWEAGRRDQVKLLLGTTVKACALGLTGMAVVLLAVHGPLLNAFFAGKYPGAPGVMGAVLTLVVLGGLYGVINPYLLCLEKPWLSAVAGGTALVVNVVLNVVLIPEYQLHGAAMATALGMTAGVGVLLVVTRRQGWRFDRGVVVLVAMPLSLLLGMGPAAAVFVVATWLVVRHGWFLTLAERSLVAEQATAAWNRFRRE